jgi:hypothetical protein
MSLGQQSTPSPLVGRVLVLSAIMMFAFALLFWNDVLPIEMSAQAKPIVAGALFLAGLLDLGLAVVMMRRAR